MTETAIDKLVQQVANSIEATNSLNVDVLKLTPGQGLLNTTIARLDAVQEAIVEIEKKAQGRDKRLETLEQLLKSLQSTQEALVKSISELPEKFGFTPKAIDSLKKSLVACTARLNEPQEQEVHHHHHLNKGLRIAIATTLLSAVLAGLLANSWSRIGLEDERDIKYRYLQSVDNTAVQKVLQWTDSTYLANPDEFRKGVVEQERKK